MAVIYVRECFAYVLLCVLYFCTWCECVLTSLIYMWLSSFLGFPSGSAVKDPPAVQKTQDTWVQSLGREDPLEEKRTTHSSILAWKITWTEEPGGLQSMGLWRVGHNWPTHTYTHTHTSSLSLLLRLTFTFGILECSTRSQGMDYYSFVLKANYFVSLI